MNLVEWVIVLVLMAVFGLLGQLLENAAKRTERRPGPERRPRPPDPDRLDEYLRELLGRSEPQAERPPAQKPQPAVPPRPRTPQTPAAPAQRVKPRPRRRIVGDQRKKPETPAFPSPRFPRDEAVIDRDLILEQSVTRPLVRTPEGPVVTEAQLARAYADTRQVPPFVRRVFKAVSGRDTESLLAAIVLHELVRAPVTQREHILPALRPLPSPLLPPPSTEGWL